MIGLTPKQSQLFRYLEGYMSSPGSVAPSFDEMKAAVGIVSKSGVHRLLGALVERGYIRRTVGRARAIEIVDQSQRSLHDATTDALVEELSRRGYFDRKVA
jgi:repressor LexA